MPGVWKTSGSRPRFNAGASLLLKDGTVLVQNDGTRQWWRLTPDNQGRYISGRWRRTAPATNAPRLFAAAVLPDGRVLIAGGGISSGQPANLNTVEIYDPAQDTWMSLPPPTGWPTIGNAPMCLLADNTLLVGSVTDNRCVVFDPTTQTWTATGAKLNQNSAHEVWTLLPDGSVLSVDCDGQQNAERYANGTWVQAGNPVAPLVAGGRIGPAVLLPNGTVFVAGATNGTGLFSGTSTWAAGPVLSQAAAAPRNARAAAACLMPNGKVLCAVADGTAPQPVTTVFVEYDPLTGTIADAPHQPPTAPGPLDLGHMLVLPDGTIMYTDGGTTICFYEPDGSPDPAWLPFLTIWPPEMQPGDNGVVEGTQFTGRSQACASGGHAAAAANHPVVRLRADQPNGTITYCQTVDPAPGGVARGTTPQSATFTVPPGLPDGDYLLAIVTNGIASQERALTIASITQSDHNDARPEQRDLQREMF